MNNPSRSRAIVLGTSMGGLLTARVLRDHFAEVILVERDSLSDAGPRKGVPQGRHTHGLLPRGAQVLEQFFPGIAGELAMDGAVLYDPLNEARRFIGGGYYCQQPCGRTGLMATRPLLEAHVRRRVLALPNVRLRDGHEALGLTAAEGSGRVNGVRLARAGERELVEVVSAGLVVDATGRGSRAPAWLAGLGYPAPEEERVEIGLGYATRFFRRRPEHLGGAKMVQVTPTPALRRAAIVHAQEGERWIMTLVGYHGDRPPDDDAGFAEFARSLPAPDVYDLIRRAEPLGDPLPATFPANQRRHYERLPRFPEGFLVTGDAISSFNPMYGQGMSVAAIEAAALAECCAAGFEGLAPRFFRRASAVVDLAWGMTAGNDRRLLAPDVAQSARTRFLQWYLGRLHVAARCEPDAALAFLSVSGLMARPTSVLRPAVALRVLRGNLQTGTDGDPPSFGSGWTPAATSFGLGYQRIPRDRRASRARRGSPRSIHRRA